MIWPWALHTPWAIAYWVGYAITWRTMTGAMAWSVHRSAKNNPTIRPPMENWVACAVPCALLSFLWFAVLWFAIPWPRMLQRGEERRAEVSLEGLELKQLELANEKRYHELTSGEVVD